MAAILADDVLNAFLNENDGIVPRNRIENKSGFNFSSMFVYEAIF